MPFLQNKQYICSISEQATNQNKIIQKLRVEKGKHQLKTELRLIVK